MHEHTRMLAAAVLLSGVVLSCGDDPISSDDEVSSESGDDDDDPSDGDCELGTEGCACELNGICEAGLACVNDLCVPAPAICGDGIQDPGEACDDGNDDNTDTCLDDCRLASCGDGYVGPGEGCDDGNDIDVDSCDNSCALASCGDGVTQAPEECDDGDPDDDDACLSTCVNASCGDGSVYVGFEDCDDANPSDTDACLTSCVSASCGDGFVQQGVEPCDDGNMLDTDACVGDCVPAECGDGFVQFGVEECDDGNMIDTDTCVAGCVAASCGDGILGPGEGCDDGNGIDDDDCNNQCALTSCGDGIVQIGEACDDGNANDTDACLSTCVDASCGDGWAQQGVEPCDDGNADNTDGCIDTCTNASCGDAYIEQGVEECDDGVDNGNNAGCTDACAANVCGDTLVWLGTEDCDDGNMVPDDGCDACNGMAPLTIVRGYDHTCLMLENGSVRCWGDGLYGQTGMGSMTDIGNGPGEMPPATINVGNAPIQLHAGGDFNCVLLGNGELRCWGHNTFGELGHGTASNVGDGPGEMPPPVTNVGGSIAQIAAGYRHNCVLLVNGQVRCWGYNLYGQLGQGHTNNLGDGPGEMPPPVVDVGVGNVVQLRAGGHHTCVLLDTNDVRCWGDGTNGALGSGNPYILGDVPGEMPPPNLDLGAGVITQLGLTTHGGCVLFENGDLRCWGRNLSGELGQGNIISIGDQPGEMPPVVTDYGAGVISELHGGFNFFQILLADGTVRNWGEGDRLGYGSASDLGNAPGEMPPNAVPLAGPVIALSKGTNSEHSCAVLQDMSVRCWGTNQNGQLGYGNILTLGDGPGEMPPAPVQAY